MGLRRAAGCTSTGEVLCIGRRCIGIEGRIRWKSVSTAEHTGKEIEDTIEIKIQSQLPVAATTQIRDVVYKLHSLDRGFARTKIISSNTDVCARSCANHSFGLVAVCLARFFITRQLKTEFINKSVRQRRGQRAGKSVALYQTVARVFLGTQRSIILVVHTGKALMVVTHTQLVVGSQTDIDLA